MKRLNEYELYYYIYMVLKAIPVPLYAPLREIMFSVRESNRSFVRLTRSGLKSLVNMLVKIDFDEETQST